MYVPYVFRSFQRFKTKDIKEFHSRRHMILILESEKSRKRLCRKCGHVLGRKRAQRVETIDITIRPASFTFDYRTISSPFYSQLPLQQLMQKLNAIEGNPQFPTFMKKLRFHTLFIRIFFFCVFLFITWRLTTGML